MKLPVLQDPPEGSKVILKTCRGQDYCSSCQLFVRNGGRCGGCTPEHKDNLIGNFAACYQECNTCAGYQVEVPAICCRSPMAKIKLDFLTKGSGNWNKPRFSYEKRPTLKFKNKAILYISNGGGPNVAKSHKSKVLIDPSQHEVVAVNLPMVWSGRGFYSRDLRDYLCLPSKVKLMLILMCKDDLLERAWDTEMYAEPEKFESVGINYWMPVALSAYRNEAHMHQYYQFLRTMWTAEKGASWFTPGNYRAANLNVDDLYMEAVAAMPQVIFNMQFAITDDFLKRSLLTFQHFHRLLPPHVSFWIVGSATPSVMASVRAVVGKRDVYYVSANLLMCAVKGKRVFPSGRVRPDPMTGRWDLVQENYKNFSALVKRYSG